MYFLGILQKNSWESDNRLQLYFPGNSDKETSVGAYAYFKARTQ